jgi:hypothetical protein
MSKNIEYYSLIRLRHTTDTHDTRHLGGKNES